MRLFFLLSSLGLISLTDCLSACKPEEECLEATRCSFYTQERKTLDSLTRNTAEWREQLRKLKSLVCNAKERKVCCEKPATNSRSPRDAPSYRPSLEGEECGDLNSHAGFILGGNDTRLGEYPFLSLLGKTKKEGSGIFWHCGGTLINKWYVLSAAHCGPKVEFVRLGEWEVVDPDTFTREAGHCFYYNDISLDKCQTSCPISNNCLQKNPNVDCDKRQNICSASHQVSQTLCPTERGICYNC